MRLSHILQTKGRHAAAVPVPLSTDISRQVPGEFRLIERDPPRRVLVRSMSTLALRVQQARIRRRLEFELSFRAELVAIGDRFAADASTAALIRALGGTAPQRVLIPGCYLAGEDVQFWLRRGVRRLDGIDLNCLEERWRSIVPRLRERFGAEIHFQQAALEKLPFADGCFDVVATNGVLEHVQNIPAVSRETARVLRSGGLAWHHFGPLYYSFGADHCIAAYGDECGYDHLLLSHDDYRSRVFDQRFYDTTADPNMPYWARHEQFSFAGAEEYLAEFRARFEILHVVCIVTEEGLRFRTGFPERWAKLLAAGIPEQDLLVKGLCILMRKRP